MSGIGLPGAPYCRWVEELHGKTEGLRQQRVAALQEAYADDAEFGYRFLADEQDKRASRWLIGRRGGCVGTQASRQGS